MAGSLPTENPDRSMGLDPGVLSPGGLRQSRRARLRTIVPSDVELLYRVELSEALGVRWRFRGSVPSPADYAESVWTNTLATFLIEKCSERTPVGVVAIYNANMTAQRASFSLAAFPGYEGTPAVMDGALLAINYAFAVWPFRKLYADVLGFNVDQLASVARHLFTEEARLSEWEFFNDQWWDLYYFSLTRERWLERRDHLIGRILP